jgi:hypothetical protein
LNTVDTATLYLNIDTFYTKYLTFKIEILFTWPFRMVLDDGPSISSIQYHVPRVESGNLKLDFTIAIINSVAIQFSLITMVSILSNSQ